MAYAQVCGNMPKICTHGVDGPGFSGWLLVDVSEFGGGECRMFGGLVVFEEPQAVSTTAEKKPVIRKAECQPK